MYNYLEEMEAEISDFIDCDLNLAEFEDKNDLEQYLNDVLFTSDRVTGNASGSYTFNSQVARDYVIDNLDTFEEVCNGFGLSAEVVGDLFLAGSFEHMDVMIRCYLLGTAISNVLEEIEL